MRITRRAYTKMDKDFEIIHNSCDVTGSTCGSSIGLGKHKSLQQQYKDKKNSRVGIKKEITPYTQSILDYGKHNEIRGIRMLNYFQPVEINDEFFYLPLYANGKLEYDKRYGATPDGLIGLDCIVEVKCPVTKEIYKEIGDGYLPLDHFCQVQMELACTLRSVGVYVCWTPVETSFVYLRFHNEAWFDIFYRMQYFSYCLNCEEDVDLKFAKGEKSDLEEKFKVFAKQSIIEIYSIKALDNKPFWI